MRSLAVAFLAIAALCSVATANIDPTRVHIVDAFNFTNGLRTYFFRGNSPYDKDADSVDYDTWVSTMANVANASGYTLPPNDRLYLVDVNLENIFDKGFLQEQTFFSSNPSKGYFINWELLGAPLWPSAFSPAEVQSMIATGKVWATDQIPTRMTAFISMLHQAPPAGYDAVAYYVHCQAGCDRTGEFVGSYRVTTELANNPEAKPVIATIFQQNCAECGRCPNYYSAGALGWYCMTVNYFNRTNMPPLSDCFTAFNCEPLGSCTATGV